MDLHEEIMALIRSKGGEVSVSSGIVTATFPDGSVWDFTKPEKKNNDLTDDESAAWSDSQGRPSDESDSQPVLAEQ